MRKQKSIKVNDELTATVFEIRPRDLYELAPALQELGENFSVQAIVSVAPDVVKRLTTLTLDQVIDLSFSEIDTVEAALREINTSFLKRLGQGQALAKKLKLDKVLSQVLEAIAKTLQREVQKIIQVAQEETPTAETSPEMPMTLPA